MSSPSFTWWPSNSWPDNSPDSLLDSCLSLLVDNPSILLDYDAKTQRYSLKPGVTLPWNFSEWLLKRWGEGKVIDEKFLHVFRNTERTRLKQLNLAETHVNDTALGWLMAHKPREVNIYQCEDVTSTALDIIQEHSENLTVLFIGNNRQMLNLCATDEWLGSATACSICALNALFRCSRLQALSIHGLLESETMHHHNFVNQMPSDLKSRLLYLDLSRCEIEMSGIGEFSNLISLILYDVPIVFPDAIFPEIGKLIRLQ